MPYNTGQGVRGAIKLLLALGSLLRIVFGNLLHILSTMVSGTFRGPDFARHAVHSHVQSCSPRHAMAALAPITPLRPACVDQRRWSIDAN